jgi:hypothetical protein
VQLRAYFWLIFSRILKSNNYFVNFILQS